MSNLAVDGIAFSFSLAILPDLSEELKIPASKVAVISSVQLGTYYLFGPVACAFVNHYGFRTVGICGFVIAFAGIFVASQISNFPAIIAFYGVFGQHVFFLDSGFANYEFKLFRRWRRIRHDLYSNYNLYWILF